MSKHWAPEDVEKLARLLVEGLSATQIAPLFGVSRNAIIGAARRAKPLMGVGFKRKAHGGRPRKKCDWTDEDRAKVAELMRGGNSTAQVALIYGITRNAVTGRVSRDKTLAAIGFHGGPGGKAAPMARIRQSPRFAGVLAAPKPRKALAVNTLNAIIARESRPVERVWPMAPTEFECRRVPLAELNRTDCKWPVNDAAKGETHLFCGLPAVERSYCAGHYGRSVRA